MGLPKGAAPLGGHTNENFVEANFRHYSFTETVPPPAPIVAEY
jgi:hypothetical protein